jgi:hypothetical protein
LSASLSHVSASSLIPINKKISTQGVLKRCSWTGWMWLRELNKLIKPVLVSNLSLWSLFYTDYISQLLCLNWWTLACLYCVRLLYLLYSGSSSRHFIGPEAWRICYTSALNSITCDGEQLHTARTRKIK